jgi:hypothetical protein
MRMTGSGRFNLTLGAVTAAVGIGAALSHYGRDTKAKMVGGDRRTAPRLFGATLAGVIPAS